MRVSPKQPKSVRFAEAVAGALAAFLPPRVLRHVYRLGHGVMWIVWWFTRPYGTGAKVAVFRGGGEVLLVRHTYGRRHWDFPGGTAGEGEAPVDTAERELREETGLHGALRALGEVSLLGGPRSATVHGFAVDVDAGTEPVVDAAEIAEARWFPVDRLPPRLAAGCQELLRRAT